jgi:hypothetical protein
MAGGAAEDTARGSPARRDPAATGGRRRERVRFQSLRVYHWILPVAGFWVRVGVRSACRVTTSPTWTQTRDGHRPCPRRGPGVFFFHKFTVHAIQRGRVHCSSPSFESVLSQ